MDTANRRRDTSIFDLVTFPQPKMKSIAIFAAALLAVAEAFPEKQMAARQTTPKIPVAVQKPIEDARLNAQTNQGCFKSAGNNMTFVTVIQYNSIGECALKTCVPKGFTAAATTGGNQCWCGYKYPPEDDLVDNKKCDVGCTGFGEEACKFAGSDVLWERRQHANTMMSRRRKELFLGVQHRTDIRCGFCRR